MNAGPSAEERRVIEGRLREAKFAMEKTVARLNIEFLRRTVAEENDEARRRRLLDWLAEEETRLAAHEASFQSSDK